MRLRDLQSDFQRHLLVHDGSVIAAVVDAPPLPAADRLGVYVNAYRVRLLDALDDTYPSLHRILVDEVFMALGEAFIETRPSVHRSIRWYGRELAEFLAQRQPYSEQPILAEIAALEWMLSEVFDAADAQAIDRSMLMTVNQDRWCDLRFRFHPSLRRMALIWNTVAVWQAVSREDEPPQPESASAPVPWLLWRQNLTNYFRSLDPAESAALATALAGSSFGEICAALEPWLPEEEIPLRAATLIGTWADSGIITNAAT